ncbi:ATP synthase F1 subunit gamma [Schleiferia thermophila]|jgi:F-type H+-transporting ATPase subunit gamma|uniref:ATP synthase gamma chain n=1 Tax=Schleiferia thermophila TaxID=884107 RepID=A0A369A3Z1_9FLAO|nr:ATP synthase F1 subunit gamma [Schleiferia thermophila]KFD39725.1 F0F1 ATP synthase subunit gamma [Schleiferia thermophila str. Yellowstone]RCX03915.1 ATP synthase F1 subcomplex gamma subunit [Schleiferia thermophila]GCD80148.1 ATP synthase gamma chain [Schleiferia thermophila]
MANLKELRKRIQSVSSTMQITSAMKMVSAAKLKKAQDSILQMRPYASKLKEILQNLNSTLEGNDGIYASKKEVKNVLLVAMTSNRGLCGAFNSNINKLARKTAEEQKSLGRHVSILCVGKKAYDYFKKLEYTIAGNESHIFDQIQYSKVETLAENLMADFRNGKYDEIHLIYNQFKNAAVQYPTVEQYLPVQKPENQNSAATDYIYEPEKADLLQLLIPKSLKIQVYKAVLDSNASEHGARMTAMHKATDNARELQRVLKLDYNKARQASITNEILEIVSGAAALNG